MKYPWGDTRRFNAYARYHREKFGGRVQKVTIDAGFTCPNRDGTLGTGGCHFCNNEGFNPSYCSPSKSVTQQISEGIEFHRWRYKKASQYLAYFQAYTNTYGDTSRIIEKYQEALNHPEVIGLVIGTRPDCLSDDLLSFLVNLSEKKHIQIEFGVETIYDATLASINRGHDYATARNAIEKTASLGLSTGAHFIFGLPGETREMMLESAKTISQLPVTTIKFHQLQILKNTHFEQLYQTNPKHFTLFGFEEYCHFIIHFLEFLNPSFVVERMAGEVPPRFQATSGWGLIRNEKILYNIEKLLEEKDTWQGKYYSAK